MSLPYIIFVVVLYQLNASLLNKSNNLLKKQQPYWTQTLEWQGSVYFSLPAIHDITAYTNKLVANERLQSSSREINHVAFMA